MKLLSWCAAIGATLVASSVSAYCVYTVFGERPPAGVQPGSNYSVPDGCLLDQPQKLHWDLTNIEYTIEPAPAFLPSGATEQSVEDGFDAWDDVPSCNAPAFQYAGVAADAVATFRQDPNGGAVDNENGVYWLTSNWPHGGDVLALTTLTFSQCSGVIVDADIEMNAADFDLTLDTQPGDESTDIANTVTHEVGHFLGLDHSDDVEATMYAEAPKGEIRKRTLEGDDAEGLCCIYDAAAPRVLPNFTCVGVVGGVTTPVTNPNEGGDDGGCAASAGSAPPISWLLGLLAVGLIRRRRTS